MAKKSNILPYRIFVQGKPFEDLTPEEIEEFRDGCARQVEKTLNDYYSIHPDEYTKIPAEKEVPCQKT